MHMSVHTEKHPNSTAWLLLCQDGRPYNISWAVKGFRILHIERHQYNSF